MDSNQAYESVESDRAYESMNVRYQAGELGRSQEADDSIYDIPAVWSISLSWTW